MFPTRRTSTAYQSSWRKVAAGSILSDRSYIIRVSGFYGYSPTERRNFGINTLKKLLRGEKGKALHDQYLSPTYVPFLAGENNQDH